MDFVKIRKIIGPGILCCLLCLNYLAMAQEIRPTSPSFITVKGRLLDVETKMPIVKATVTAKGEETVFVLTDDNGFFVFPDLPVGTYTFTASAPEYEDYGFSQSLSADRQLGTLFILPLSSFADESRRAADYIDMDYDNEADLQDVSPILHSSRDVFTEMASYNFSQVRFKPRGYDSKHQNVYMNGVLLNDMNTGSAVWSLWGGLNDAIRNQETSIGIEAGDYTFGNIGGATNIDVRASGFRPGLKLTYSLSNRTYANRIMVSCATGLLKGGWALSFVGSRRWGEQGYSTGTFYDAWSYFLSVEKRFNPRHTLSLTAFGSPTQRGVASGSTREAYELSGSNYYNPNLGYQNGKLRNARVRNNHEPVILLNYFWNMNARSRITASLAYRFGYNGYSALNWYDTPDPRPDYYRNFPSYYENNPYLSALYTEAWKNPDADARYLNWDRMYNVNYLNNETVTDDHNHEIANGLRSKYIVEDRRADQRQLTANLLFHTSCNNHVALHAALVYRTNTTAYFKTVQDLMGGDYWYDIDQFAERDFGNDIHAIQSDLNKPFRIVHEGDVYGYNYDAHIRDFDSWVKLTLDYPRWEGYAALSGGCNSFYRKGQYRKGLFPDDSYGKSELRRFFHYGAKGGVTCKISGWHYLSANAAFIQQAPNFQDSYISPRTRNTAVNDLKEEILLSADLNYNLRSPRFKMRLTGYCTRIQNQTKIISFYDDYYRSFGNYAMTGIDRRYWGIEWGAEYKFSPALSLEGAFAWGDYSYVSNPDYTQTVDNTNEILESSKVYWSGCKVAGTPRSAASLSLNYNAPRYFYAGLTGNYFSCAWIDMNPVRRTDKARTELDPVYVQQERLDGGVTVDAFLGLNFRIKYKYYININFNISNILDNRTIHSGGYEHMRVARSSETETMTKPFDSRYFYMWGRNFFFNCNFRF